MVDNKLEFKFVNKKAKSYNIYHTQSRVHLTSSVAAVEETYRCNGDLMEGTKYRP